MKKTWKFSSNSDGEQAATMWGSHRHAEAYRGALRAYRGGAESPLIDASVLINYHMENAFYLNSKTLVASSATLF